MSEFNPAFPDLFVEKDDFLRVMELANRLTCNEPLKRDWAEDQTPEEGEEFRLVLSSKDPSDHRAQWVQVFTHNDEGVVLSIEVGDESFTEGTFSGSSLRLEVLEDGRIEVLDGDVSKLYAKNPAQVITERLNELIEADAADAKQNPDLRQFELDPSELSKLADEQSQAILSKTIWRGENLPNYPLVDAELVNLVGLTPKYKMRIGNGISAYFSPTYFVEEGNKEPRLAINAYLDDGSGIIARSYYLSASQAVWRYLPNRSYDFKKGEVNHLGKLKSDSAVDVPIELQKALWQIFKSGKVEILPEHKSGACAIFYNTVGHNPRSNEVKHEPEDISQPLNHYLCAGDVPNPSLVGVDLPQNSLPNFYKVRDNWLMETPLHGQLMATVFESVDGTLRYQFLTNAEGQTWIAHVESVSAKTDSTLTLARYFYMPELTAPVYETRSQAGQYAYQSLSQPDRLYELGYSNIFDVYQAKVPIIAKFTKKFISSKNDANKERKL